MKKKSSHRHLTDKDVAKIVDLLDGWKGSLTWEGLCNACPEVIGFKPTRQTLSRFENIARTYKLAKERARDGAKNLKAPPTLAAAAQRIERLTREVERLERENSALLERFVTWQYNAYAHGLSQEQLNKGLFRVDRDQTE